MHRLMLAWALVQMGPDTAEEIAAEFVQLQLDTRQPPGQALQTWARNFLTRNADTIREMR